jgi:RimJ/RimL family protein N-acetyltransferase
LSLIQSSPRLQLRPLKPTDARALFAYRSLSEVYIYQSWNPAFEEEALSFILDQEGLEFDTPGTWYQLGITLLKTGALIGDCGLHFPSLDGCQVEIGITLAPAWWRKGYATETLTSLFDYLFTELGKHRVYASVDPRNQASSALMKRMGMREEGVFLRSVWCRGEWTDDAIYAILDEEWMDRKAR